MIIFPAIDIKDGKCVRLFQGNFEKITSYKRSPVDQATAFFQTGFKEMYRWDSFKEEEECSWKTQQELKARYVSVKRYKSQVYLMKKNST